MVTLRPPSHVGVEVHAETVYVAPLPDGPILVLEGVAALIWRAAVSMDREDAIAEVAARTDSEVALIRHDVDAFLDDMVARGLVVEHPFVPPGTTG